MASGKFRWISAAENCQIWDENFEVVHKFEEGFCPVATELFKLYDENSLVSFVRKCSGCFV